MAILPGCMSVPPSSADIADDETADTPDHPQTAAHPCPSRSAKCRRTAAKRMLDLRGNTRRSYRNTLVFLAADRNRLEDLKQGVRQFLAWDSIYQENETLNLDRLPKQSSKDQTRRGETRASTHVFPKPISGFSYPINPIHTSPTCCKSSNCNPSRKARWQQCESPAQK